MPLPDGSPAYLLAGCAAFVLGAACTGREAVQAPSASARPPVAPAPAEVGGEAPAPETTPPPPAFRPSPSPRTSRAPQRPEQVPVSSPRCALELRTRATWRGDVLTLVAVALNRTSRALELRYVPACPGGPVGFEGLRPRYDFEGTCTMGACPDNPLRRTSLALGPNQRRTLTRIETRPRTAGSCNPKPVAPGDYPVQVVAPLGIDVPTCVAPAQVRIGAPARRTKRTEAPAAPVRCPALACALRDCPGGTRRDERGCPTCTCADPNPIAQ